MLLAGETWTSNNTGVATVIRWWCCNRRSNRQCGYYIFSHRWQWLYQFNNIFCFCRPISHSYRNSDSDFHLCRTTSQLLAVVPGSTPTTVCQTNNAQAGFAQGNPDLTRTVTIAGIPAGVTITGITVTVNASHQRDNEVEMYLIPPASDGGVALGGPGGGFQHTTTAGGNLMLLGTPVGTPVNGPNYVNTVFSDLGATTLAGSGGTGPYTGTYKPASNPFTSITPTMANSANVNGTWTFVILDHVNSGFTGVFNNYTLCISYTSANVTYSWTSAPPGFTSAIANPTVTPAATTVYSVTATATNGCTSTPATATVTVTPAPSITLGPNPSVCRGTTTTNLTYTAVTGAPNQYSIVYSAAALAAGFVNVTNVALPASPIVLTVPAGAAAAVYTATLTVKNTVSGCPSVGVPFTVTVVAAPTITLGANPTVCSGATTANLPYSATTGAPNQYSIVYNAAALAAGFVNVTNVALPATPIVLTVPAGAAAATYNGTLTVSNSATGCPSAGSPIAVIVTTAPTITLGASPTVCAGTTTASLPYTGTTGAPNQYSITYNAAALAAGFVNVPNTALPASPITLTVPAGAATATYNGTLTPINTTTGCPGTAVPFTVTVSAAPTITLGLNPTVCAGTTTANLPYTGTTGAPNQYSITYNAAAIAAGFVSVTNVALPATPIVLTVPAGAAAATYNATLTVRNSAAGCSSTAVPITVTVTTAPTITLGASPTVCSGTTTANLPYTGTTGAPNQYSITYNAAAIAAGFVNVPNTALPATPIVLTVPAGAALATYNGTITVTNTTTGCPGTAVPFTVTVTTAPSITLGPNPTVCIGTTTANLPYTGTTGAPNQYSIVYNAAALAAGFANVTNAVLPASPIVLTVPAAAPAATYNGTLTVTNTATGCPSTPVPFTVTVNPAVTFTPTPGSGCAGVTTGNLPYTSTGGPNQYSITYNAASITAGFVNVTNVALPASPVVLTVPAGAAAAAYGGNITATNTTTGCSQTKPFTYVVLAAPAAPTASVTVQPTCAITTGTIVVTAPTGAGLTYSINGVTYQAGTTFAGLAPGPYNVTVKNASGCVSPATPLTVNPVPTPPAAPTASVTVQPTCATPTGTIVVTAPTGAGLTYSIDGTNYQAGTTFTAVAPGPLM